MVRFFLKDGDQRLGVEINQSAADAYKLKIRAKLMRLASIVTYPLPPMEPS